MTGEDVERAIRSFWYSWRNEAELHEAIAQALEGSKIPFRREVSLPEGRVDFMVDDGIAVEVKIGGSLTELLRQCQRYARSSAVTEVVVVTNLPRLTSTCPYRLAGKVVRVVTIQGGL